MKFYHITETNGRTLIIQPVRDTENPQICVTRLSATGNAVNWRITALRVPADLRAGGRAGELLQEAMAFIAEESAGAPYQIFLESAPITEPGGIPADALRRFYEKRGFHAWAGHPFALYWKK